MRKLIMICVVSIVPAVCFTFFYLLDRSKDQRAFNTLDIIALVVEAALSFAVASMTWWLWKTRGGKQRS